MVGLSHVCFEWGRYTMCKMYISPHSHSVFLEESETVYSRNTFWDLVNITDPVRQNLVIQDLYQGSERELPEEDGRTMRATVHSAGIQSQFCSYLEHTGVYKSAGLPKPVFKSPNCDTNPLCLNKTKGKRNIHRDQSMFSKYMAHMWSNPKKKIAIRVICKYWTIATSLIKWKNCPF